MAGLVPAINAVRLHERSKAPHESLNSSCEA